MSGWDGESAAAAAGGQDLAVAAAVSRVAARSPYWSARLAELGRNASSLRTVRDLAGLPAAGERDVCADGDPAGMAGLVVHPEESDVLAASTSWPALLWRRLRHPDAYRRALAAGTRPTTFLTSGAGMRYLLAYTRADLDVLARCGARLWQVLGLGPTDILVSGAPTGQTVEHVGLVAAAQAAGAPAAFPGERPAAILAAYDAMHPTVLALSAATAAATLAQIGVPETVRTLLLVGAPTSSERKAAQAALTAAGSGASMLAVHAPAGARVLWGECPVGRAAAGFHTYPDLEVVQLVDPETGLDVGAGDPGTPETAVPAELVLTQLDMSGSALLRWRTGDLVDALSTDPCPGCGRRVPRVTSLRAAGLVVSYVVGDRRRRADLRGVAGALLGRADVADWQVILAPRSRDGRRQVVVHVVPTASADPAVTALAVADDILALVGVLPTQIVLAAELGVPEPTAGQKLLGRHIIEETA